SADDRPLMLVIASSHIFIVGSRTARSDEYLILDDHVAGHITACLYGDSAADRRFGFHRYISADDAALTDHNTLPDARQIAAEHSIRNRVAPIDHDMASDLLLIAD